MRLNLMNRNGDPMGEVPDILEARQTVSVDGKDTLDMTVLGEISKDDRIVYYDKPLDMWHEYICQGSSTQRATGIPVTTAYCTNSIAELEKTYIEDKRNRQASAEECLRKALEGTRWSVERVEASDVAAANISFYHTSVLKAVQQVANTFHLEIETNIGFKENDPNRVGERTISLVQHRGSRTAKHRFEYGVDLIDVKRDVDSSTVVTRLYGWGKGVETTDKDGNATGGYGRKLDFASVNNGVKYVEDAAATALWGVKDAQGNVQPSVGEVEFSDCEDASKLLALTKARLKTLSKPIISYEASVSALNAAGYTGGVAVGDEVRIVDTTFPTPLRLEGRVLKVEQNLIGSADDVKVTLGAIRESSTQAELARRQKLDQLITDRPQWDNAANLSNVYIQTILDRVNELLNAKGGYTYLKPGKGIFVYDKPEDQNPTSVIQIGGGYWRVASSKNSDGSWNFQTLADGHGLIASRIYTGMIRDAAGKNYWDLDTGNLSISSTTTVNGTNITLDDRMDSTARQQVEQYDERLTQQSVFNKLTNNGETQGIYLTGSRLYINASYLQTGIISDRSGRNYWNLNTGELSISSTTTVNGTGTTLDEHVNNIANQKLSQVADQLTQRKIFDKLTNYGQTQGLYLSGGRLYVNATYMKAGIISGGRSYWNLDDGTMRLVQGYIGGLTISENSLYNNSFSLDESGIRFYQNGSLIGHVGSNYFGSDPSYNGIVFDLDNNGDYLAWGSKNSPSDDIYAVQLLYSRSDHGNYTAGLNVATDLNMQNNAIKNFTFDPNNSGPSGGINGTMNFIKVNSIDAQNGIVRNWSNDCHLTFKHGILVSATF